MFDSDKIINRYGDVDLDVTSKSDEDKIVRIGKALSHPIRIKMLNQILKNPRSITELGKLNNLTNSSVIFHLNLLEEAELIVSRVKPNKKGKTLVFYVNFSQIGIATRYNAIDKQSVIEQSVGVGNYQSVAPTGYVRIATENQFFVLEKDDLYNPIRFDASLICLDNGEITYAFSNAYATRNTVNLIEFSLEICSESPYYCNDWKSEITFAVNDVELGSYLSLGDFGGIRGKLSPAWYDDKYSQYGLLTTVAVDEQGVMINGERVASSPTLHDLNLGSFDKTTLTIKTKESSTFAGGFNIFGKHFGNEPQDIIMRATGCPKNHENG